MEMLLIQCYIMISVAAEFPAPDFIYDSVGSKVKTRGMSANALARRRNLHNVR